MVKKGEKRSMTEKEDKDEDEDEDKKNLCRVQDGCVEMRGGGGNAGRQRQACVVSSALVGLKYLSS